MVKDRVLSASLRTIARVAGVLYLIIIVTAGFAQLVRQNAIELNDPTATAENILDSETLFRLSISADMIAFTTDAALAVVLYLLLRPVSESLALLAAFFRLGQAATLGVNIVNQVGALLLVNGGDYLSGFDELQLQDLAYFLLELHDYGYLIGLVFFAASNVVLGYLVFRSGYFPKILGLLLMIVVPAGYLIDTFGHFLVEDFSSTISDAVIYPVAIVEVAFCVWLLVKAVDIDATNEEQISTT